MRMINADALRHWIEGECKSPSIPRNEAAFGRRILMHMELMESEDVQPVVRCSECEHWDNGICYCDDYEIHSPDYYVGDMHTEPDFFCGFGERGRRRQ